MIVSTNQGDAEYNSIEEIEQLIRQSAASSSGDFWIGGEEPYPCLNIIVKGECACVHYFADDQGDVWQSLGNFEEDVTFLTDEGEWEAPAEVVVTLEAALACIREFFLKEYKRPKCMDWEELWG